MKRTLKITKGGISVVADASDCECYKGHIPNWVWIHTHDGCSGSPSRIGNLFDGPKGDRFLTRHEEDVAVTLMAEAMPWIQYWEGVARAQAG